MNTHCLDRKLVSPTVWIHAQLVIPEMYHSMRHIWPLGLKSVANFCAQTKGGGRGPIRKARLRRLMQFQCPRFARDKNFLFLMSDQMRRHGSSLYTAKLKGGTLMKELEEMITAKGDDVHRVRAHFPRAVPRRRTNPRRHLGLPELPIASINRHGSDGHGSPRNASRT